MSTPSDPPPVWGGQPTPPYPGQPAQPNPGQPYPGQPYPGQPYPGQLPPPSGGYPGQPYPPGMPYQQPPKKRRIWPWVLAGSLALAAVVIGGIVLVVVRATQGPRDAMRAYVAAVAVEDYPKSFALLCDSVQDGTTLGDYTDLLSGQHDDDKQAVSVSIRSTRVSNGSSAQISGTEKLADGATLPFTATLAKQHGGWKLCDVQD